MPSSPAAGRLSLPWIILCLLPGLCLVAYYEMEARAVTAAGFPLDDAWIHAQFARNIATGHGFSYTGGQWVAGSTAPAWTLLLALGYLAVPNMVIVGKVLGFALQAATAVAAARFGGWLSESRVVAFASGAVTASVPIMVWGAVSGMEVPLAAFLVVAGVYLHLRHRETLSWRATIGTGLLALSVLARPECLVLVAFALGDLCLRLLVLLVRRDESVRPRMIVLAGALAIAGLVIGSWIGFNYATIGRPLPTTFYAKSGSGLMRAIEQRDGAMARRTFEVYGPQALTNFGIILREQLGWAVWLVPAGLVYCAVGVRRRAAVAFLALVLIGAPFVMGLTAPQRLKPSNERYAPHLIALAAILAAAGIAPICRAAARDRRLAAATALLPVALVYAVAAQPQIGAFYFARSVKNIQELHVRLGEWIRWHIPQGSVVATNDVGAIAYFGGHRILDIEGLVSPESLAIRGQGRGLKVVETFRPDYLAIFPHWYPEIAALPDRFRLVHRVMIGDNYISAGGEFLVLQAPWARVPLLPPSASPASPASTLPASN
jgi:hypothetical protein